MQAILSGDSTLIVAMIVAYIAFTSWLTFKLRSRTSDQFMTASRAMPAVVVGVLMMSEFIGAKSTVGTAQEAFQSGMAAAWAVLGASLGFLLFGLLMVKKLYNSGEYTISAAIAQKYGKSTMLTVSVIMIYALLLVNVGNYVSGAAAIATALHVSLPVAMCVIAVVSHLLLRVRRIERCRLGDDSAQRLQGGRHYHHLRGRDVADRRHRADPGQAAGLLLLLGRQDRLHHHLRLDLRHGRRDLLDAIHRAGDLLDAERGRRAEGDLLCGRVLSSRSASCSR